MTPSPEYLLPRDVSLFVAQLLALVIVMGAMWAAKRWGGAADRDYRDDRPTPGHVQRHGPPVKPQTPLVSNAQQLQAGAPEGFRLPVIGLHHARDAWRSH